MRPDFVLILTDQQRFDQVGYESEGHYETPTIDRLARQGVAFANAYSASTTCVPARASLLTGLHHHRVPTQLNRLALREGFWTVARALHQVGYHTALIGKMHFAPVRAQHGFETMRLCEHLSPEQVGPASTALPNQLDDYHEWLVGHGLPDWRTDLVDGKPAATTSFPYDPQFHPTAWIESEVMSFLADRDGTRPLFLVVSFPHPHAPYNPPEPYASMYEPGEAKLPTDGFDVNEGLPGPFLEAMTNGLGPFPPHRADHNGQTARRWLTAVRALVKHIDDSVGRILTKIDSSRSLIFFTSDHGDYAGHRGMLKKVPWIPFDDLARVPLVVSGYGVKGGRRVASLVQTSDFALTCLDYADVAMPPGLFDSTSLRPHLQDRAGRPDRERTVMSATSTGWPMVRRDGFKYLLDERSNTAVLFDMVNDPGESINALEDPSHRSVAEELSLVLREELARPIASIGGVPGSESSPPSSHKDIQVPLRFVRGAVHGDDQTMQSALWLLRHVCQHLGLYDLADVEMLDFGCGVKFTEALINCRLPIRRYVGVDVYEDMIRYLQDVVDDERFEYFHLGAHNERYNPHGQRLSETMQLPIDGQTFDLIGLFSVFTHLRPHDYRAMLKLLRRYAKDDTRLIYSLYIDELTQGGSGLMDAWAKKFSDDEDAVAAAIVEHLDPATGGRRVEPFTDLDPSRPLLWAVYSENYARQLIEETGWNVLSLSPPDRYIQHHFICAPC